MNEALFKAAAAAVSLGERQALDVFFDENVDKGVGMEDILHAVEVAEMQLH